MPRSNLFFQEKAHYSITPSLMYVNLYKAKTDKTVERGLLKEIGQSSAPVLNSDLSL